MTEGMPADLLLDSGFSSNWLDVALHKIVRPVGLFSFHGRTRKHPIVGHWVRTLATPALQVLCHILVHWDGLSRRLGLTIADHLCQIEWVTRSSKFSKSTSLQRSANSSL